MTAGASKAAPTTIQQPALAPSPQPRPAPTGRALPPNLAAQGGQNWTPIRGQIWAPIDMAGHLCTDHWFGSGRERSSRSAPRGENKWHLVSDAGMTLKQKGKRGAGWWSGSGKALRKHRLPEHKLMGNDNEEAGMGFACLGRRRSGRLRVQSRYLHRLHHDVL